MIYDLIIVGAGPAGATFARLIADSGHRILLLDAQTEQNKKPCGGLLAPDAQKALAHFDLVLPKEVLVGPQIFSVKTIDIARGQTRHYSRHYLNIDRYAFDKWLVSLIPPAAEQLCGKCVDIQREGDLFALTVVSGGKTSSLRTRQLVGADGANSIVRQRLFGDAVMHYVAIQQWFRASASGNAFYSCVFDEKTSESCSWSIYKDDYFIFGGCFAPAHCREAFETQKKRIAASQGFDFTDCVKTEACLALRPRRLRDFNTGAPRVYLIGEAAGFISPSSFEGISNAIISGRLLAEAFRAQGDAAAIQRQYRKSTRGLRGKLALKMFKRWFMYTPFVRHLVLKTGVGSIRLWTGE